MKKLLAFLTVLTLLLLITKCQKNPKSTPADLVLHRGKILTLDSTSPQAEALAVQGEKIIAVGSYQDIKSLVGPKTEVIDLKGKLVVPGLIDAHGHFMSLGESLMGINLRRAPTWESIVKMVADAVKEAKPGEWIVGRGWHQDEWEKPPSPSVEDLPVHQGLSQVSPDNPVLLIHNSGHGVFVNKKAMEKIGITSELANPPGGEIVRDIKGNPTGMLRETAQDMARAALARYKSQRPQEDIEAELRQQVKLAAAESIANGVTTFHDMGETFETIDLLKRMADEGQLPLRLYVAVEESSEDLKGKLDQYRMVGYGKGFLTVRMIGEKVLDGALGVHGGWLLEPYTDLPRTSGFNVVPVSDIRESASLAIKHGYQMAIQGIGDRAVRELFNIYETEFRKNPDKKDLRWRIEHCQVVHPEDVPRFKKLGVIASIRGVFATSDAPWVIKRLGEKRARERGYLYQTFFQSGATVINGTDPPVEDINPIKNFYDSVTRKLPDGSIFFPEQRLTRQQALESYTINNAFAAFEEDIKGTLTVGKLADITVISKDILTIPEDEILTAKVVLTIIGGKIKYRVN
jgi:predicted amidohydrolase YtcJ